MHPAETTMHFDLANSVKSAETSNSYLSANLWTPPIPPVENTSIRTYDASLTVAATVVDAVWLNARIYYKSYADAFKAWDLDNYSISLGFKPIIYFPFITAIVAGVTLKDRAISSNFNCVSKFVGYGKPCVIMVLSKARIGKFCDNAYKT